MSNPNEGIVQLLALPKSSDFELGIIRIGNIYSTIFNIQIHYQLHKEAIMSLSQMKQSIPNFMMYLDQETVSMLCQATGISSDMFLDTDNYDGKVS